MVNSIAVRSAQPEGDVGLGLAFGAFFIWEAFRLFGRFPLLVPAVGIVMVSSMGRLVNA